MRYYAGIDGGQTSTIAVIADETGRILGRGKGAAADEVGQGPDSTRLHDALSDSLRAAVAQAQLPQPTRFARIVAGISGYQGRPHGRQPQLPADEITLEHDAPIAHCGAFAGGPGVIVIAGTGSVAYAVNERGARSLTGGWGYLFGDEGSGFALARSAISDAMRDADAGRLNELASPALQHFDCRSLRDLAREFYAGRISRTQLAAFAAVVAEHAERGSAAALQYLDRCADALVQLTAQALERADMQSDAARVAFTGGMVENCAIFAALKQGMRVQVPLAHVVRPCYDPAIGALLLAYRADGIETSGIAQ